MVFKRNSIRYGMTLIGVIIAFAGLSILFGWKIETWTTLLFGLLITGVLLIEVGIKEVTNFSNIKKLGIQQYITLFVAGLIGTTAILNFLGIIIQTLNTITGIAYVLAGGIFMLETWTNM